MLDVSPRRLQQNVARGRRAMSPTFALRMAVGGFRRDDVDTENRKHTKYKYAFFIRIVRRIKIEQKLACSLNCNKCKEDRKLLSTFDVVIDQACMFSACVLNVSDRQHPAQSDAKDLHQLVIRET